MKTKNSFLTILTIVLALAMLAPGCKKKKVDEPLPDGSFKATVIINGQTVQNIDVIMVEQVSTTGAANGSYSPIQGLFQMLGLEGATWSLALREETGGVKTGSWQLNDGVLDVATYFHTTIAPNSFSSTSGTLTISKVNLWQEFGGTKDYFIDGSFDLQISDGGTPAITGSIAGTFKGINIKEQ